MRLALPYLGVGLCASLAAWMSVMLFYWTQSARIHRADTAL